MEPLIDTWHIHNRIQLYLIDSIAPEAFAAKPQTKGRTVGEMFAHMHNVRLEWLESAKLDMVPGLAKIEKDEANDPAFLRRSFEQSGLGIASLIKHGLQTGKISGFKPHPTAFFGYLISHESYHRGEISMVLAQVGHKLDQKTSYGMWEWGVR
jgi:uncharacterized damage-inducible protein DinB